MHRTLTDLSTELLVDILGYLPYLQLVRCRRVCKELQITIDNTPSLQCTIELSAASYEISNSSTVGVVDVLNSFRRTQRAYRNPNPRSVRISLNKVTELTSRCWSALRWHAFGDIIVGSVENDSRTLGVLTLRGNMPAENRVHILTLAVDMFELNVDPSQGLLIVWTPKMAPDQMRFLSLADGLPHRKATVLQDGAIPFPIGFDWHRGVRLVVSGDWVLLCSESGSIPGSRGWNNFLYHWPSGELSHKWISCMEDVVYPSPGCLAQGCVFLLVIVGNSFQIDIYRVPDNHTKEENAVHIASYGFPGKPALLPSINIATLPLCDSTVGPAASMLQMTFGIISPMCISLSALLAEATKFEARNMDASHTPATVPWETWGPQNTRIIENTRQLAAFGRRVLCDDAIIDFNPYDIANDIYAPAIAHGRTLRSTGADYSGAIHTAPSMLPHYVGFRGPIVTQLPYRKTHLFISTFNWDDAFCLFEEDGVPKAAKVAFTPYGTPKYLQIYTL